MIKKVVLASVLLGSVGLYAAQTTTETTFSAPTVSKDKYGNTVYVRDATIKTHNFKVQNFWKGFSFGGERVTQNNYDLVSRTGTFKITIESTSACSLNKGLPEEGCSGQKPFLLNDEVLNNPMSGTTDMYEVAFSEAANYNNSEDNTFYPLDIQRDAQYYKDPNPSDPNANIDRGFFGFFTSAFDYMFSKTVGFGNDFFGDPQMADVKYGPRDTAAEDRRQRYIANIMAGIEKKYRMTMAADGATATQVNAGIRLNDPVSLLHYDEAQQVTEADQCKFMFLNLSDDGLMCRAMSGFGMDVWMPFFNTAQIRTIEASTIMADTENSLLAMTNQIDGVPYMEDVGGSDDDKLGFLQNMLKPMTTMMGFMKSMMFGSGKATKVSNPVERVYEFDEDKAMTLNFAITNDGTQVDDFENFKLMKVRSVYGDMFDSCTVHKKRGMMSWSKWTETFVIGGSLSKKGPDGKIWNSDKWVDWCQEATGRKGMFDYLFDWSKGGVFNPFNWMRGFFNAFLTFLFGSYDILDFTSAVHRGLILEIKKVTLDPISPYNTRTVEVQKID